VPVTWKCPDLESARIDKETCKSVKKHTDIRAKYLTMRAVMVGTATLAVFYQYQSMERGWTILR
jgi:hypothetical protein